MSDPRRCDTCRFYDRGWCDWTRIPSAPFGVRESWDAPGDAGMSEIWVAPDHHCAAWEPR